MSIKDTIEAIKAIDEITAKINILVAMAAIGTGTWSVSDELMQQISESVARGELDVEVSYCRATKTTTYTKIKK